MAENLMKPYQSRRSEPQEADGVWNNTVFACFDECLVESNVGAPAAQAGIDNAERFGCRS